MEKLKKIKIYLMRHGQTILNKAKRTQGWCDGVLTDDGIDVAVNVGFGLRDIKFKGVYSSDLGRAMKTAVIVINENKYKDNLHIQEKEGLREFYFGSFEGELESVVFDNILRYLNCNSFEEIESKYDFQRAYCDACNALDETNEAENYDKAVNRVMKTLTEICTENISDNEENILIVAHGGIIRIIIDYLDKSFDVRNIDNSSICELEYSDGNFKVLCVNDNSYSEKGKVIRLKEDIQ